MEDEIETMNIMMDDDIVIPNTNTIGRGTGPPKRKKIITSHLTQAVRAADRIKSKYRKKRIGKKAARISTDGLLKNVNEKNTEWLKKNGFLNNNISAEKAM